MKFAGCSDKGKIRSAARRSVWSGTGRFSASRACSAAALAISACALATATGLSPAYAQQSASSMMVQQPTESEKLKDALSRLALNSRNVEALIDAGNAALDLDNITAAFGFFGRAQEIEPGNPRLKAGLGRAMLRSQDPYAALHYFEEAVKGGVALREIAADRALAWDLVGNNGNALADYRRAMEYDRHNPELITRYALSLAVAGKRAEAAKVIDDLLRKGDRSAWRIQTFILAIFDEQEDAGEAAMSVMPPGTAQQMEPYLERMPDLTPAQQVAAAWFGHFPEDKAIGIDDARNRRYVSAGAKGDRRAFDAGLIPAGEPLGRKKSGKGADKDKAEAEAKASKSKKKSRSGDKRTAEKRESKKSSRKARAEKSESRKSVRSASARKAGQKDTAKDTAKDATRVADADSAKKQQQALAEKVEAAKRSQAAEQDEQARALASKARVVADTSQSRAAATNGAASAGKVEASPVVTAATDTKAPQTASGSNEPVKPQQQAENGADKPVYGPPKPGFASLAETGRSAQATGPAEQKQPDAAADKAVTTAAAAPDKQDTLAKAESEAAQRQLALAQIVAEAAKSAVPASSSATATPGVAQTPAADKKAAEPDKAAKPASAAKAKPDDATKSKQESSKKETSKKETSKKESAKKESAKKEIAKKEIAKKESDSAKQAHKARHWVQISIGSPVKALPREYKRVSGKAPDVFKGQKSWWAPLGKTNRILIGPFNSGKEAQEMVNKLREVDIGAYRWDSEAGEEVTPLK